MFDEDELGIYPRGVVIIRFFDQDQGKLLKVKDIDVNMVVTISVEGADPIVYSPDGVDREMTDLNIYFTNYLNLQNLKGYKPVSVSVTYSNVNYRLRNYVDAQHPSTARAEGTYISTRGAYSGIIPNDGKWGLWFPALQFSTNFRATAQGIPFATLPIGAAFGSKWYYGSTGAYVGCSLMANWFLYKRTGDNTAEDNEAFTFNSLTIGVLLDVSDYVTLGYAYGFQFASNAEHPGSMFVIGIGTEVFSFLKSAKITPKPPKV
jgi:hypothetical protein